MVQTQRLSIVLTTIVCALFAGVHARLHERQTAMLDASRGRAGQTTLVKQTSDLVPYVVRSTLRTRLPINMLCKRPAAYHPPSELVYHLCLQFDHL